MDLWDYGGHSPSLHSLAVSWVAVIIGSTPELIPHSNSHSEDGLDLLCLRVFSQVEAA